MSKLRGINVNNNIQIECDKKSVSISALKNGVQLALLDCQSIKNKDAYVKDLMDNYELDALLLTETWLQGDDVTWCLQSQLNQNGTKLDHCDRKDRPGGGIGLVYRDNSKVKLIKHDILRTFEYAIWKLVSGNICFHIIGIYRPPYSEKHRWTVNHFIDEITEFLTDVLPSIKNPIIMGDFNIHIDDESDAEACIFADIMNALGFIQHVTFSTQRHGHILDHIYTEVGSTISIASCCEDVFVSDHCLIRIFMNIPREDICQKRITFRKTNDLPLEEISRELSMSLKSSSTDGMVQEFENNVTAVLDKFAPVKSKIVTVRRKKPWFTREIAQQKHTVRRRERIFRKFKENHQLIALKKERNRYNWMIKQAKNVIISAKIIHAKGDSKQLYRIFKTITGDTQSNPFPEGRSHEQLAEEFANLFMDKTIRIRESLKHIHKYTPNPTEAPKLDKFTSLTTAEIRNIVNSMKTKHANHAAKNPT
ncbi:hypothetical protein SNE40_010887 [Patella caerulea]|uniref:Endonuclease/exonuclease/phosphatase domain-containing protein n=1 Tax=Patella caerulea TaxID=87958 RepID=A0AAN8K1V9_PATCE